jgi:HPt (histidine-containing phosphotransfer) domain-containing protein
VTQQTAPRFRVDAIEEACEGIADLVAEVLEAFLAAAPEDIGRAVAALAEGERGALRRALYRLEGSSLVVGAEELASTCRRVERHARDATALDSAMGVTLADEWGPLRAAIETYLGSLRPGAVAV